jgi:hypothetical protein
MKTYVLKPRAYQTGAKLDKVRPLKFELEPRHSLPGRSLQRQIELKIEELYKLDTEARAELLSNFELKIDPSGAQWNQLRSRYLSDGNKIYSDFRTVDKPLRGKVVRGGRFITKPDSARKADTNRPNFINFFVKSWRRRYRTYMAEYAQAEPDYSNGKWSKWKKIAKASGLSSQHNGQKIKYTGPALATGFLRASVEKSFQKGGGPHVPNMPNPMISRWADGRGNFNFNYSHPDYKNKVSGKSYPREFEKKLHSIGVEKVQNAIVSLDAKDWEDLADMVIDIYKKGPIEDIYEIFAIYGIEMD